MPRMWNIGHQPLVVGANAPAVEPGESFNFSDEQAAALNPAIWLDHNPYGPRIRRSEYRNRAAKTTDPAPTPEKQEE